MGERLDCPSRSHGRRGTTQLSFYSRSTLDAHPGKTACSREASGSLLSSKKTLSFLKPLSEGRPLRLAISMTF